MNSSYRQNIIRLFTFIGGAYFVFEFLLPTKLNGYQFGKFHEEISIGFSVMSVMAVGLGILNLLAVHGSRVAFKRSGWANSLGLLVSLFAMLSIMSLNWRASQQIASKTQEITMLASFADTIVKDAEQKNPAVPAAKARADILYQSIKKNLGTIDFSQQIDIPISDVNYITLKNYKNDLQIKTASLTTLTSTNESAELKLESMPVISAALSELAVAERRYLKLIYDYSLTKQIYNLFYDGLFISLGSAMFALLGFYIAGAAYRAFRIKSAESALMMVAAIIVMLGQIPFGIWIWDGFTGLRLWLLQTPSSGAFRAIYFGAAIAGLGMAFRMWLSIESQSFSRKNQDHGAE